MAEGEEVSVWVRFDEGLPPWLGTNTAFLVRPTMAGLPQVARYAPGSSGAGLHVSFAPFEGAEMGLRGIYYHMADLVEGGWSWAPIPE